MKQITDQTKHADPMKNETIYALSIVAGFIASFAAIAVMFSISPLHGGASILALVALVAAGSVIALTLNN